MTGEILFIAHRAPYPPDRGDRMRAWPVLRALARLAPTHLACFADGRAEVDALGPILPLLASAYVEQRAPAGAMTALRAIGGGRPVSLTAFESPSFAAHVKGLLSERDITHIYVFSGQMAQFVPAGRTFVMDFVDVDSAKFEAYGRSPFGWIYRREARLLAGWEAEVAARADRSLFVSDAEAALFRARSGQGDRVETLANGVDTDRYDPGFPAEAVAGRGPLIAFTGQMDYRPNVEAVIRFARDTLPLIRARRPDARFAIVGRAPTAAVRALARQTGVIVTGEVPDIRPWLAAANIIVAPLGLARGVQNKLLEAMAMARPVVASPAAVEGIDAIVGEEIVIADGAPAEAAAILSLIADPARASAIGAAARARMLGDYGWSTRLAALPALLGRESVPA
ncbi:MAG: TIGR03087 family PEP-CTERM/XrtA system glycosyltransferase [Sphingomonas sanxanigenens]|uniref:TIGR03087 family PEP-CTERM/XrtA system glycosyltransferase n=1 Tax=Sphingomonas sanxanigenens TaxID=397260 RepID=A0A2W5ABG7_9SPHN|nr:MAG: TIGR03087 family PEP-CTERM/XrtA system glycosyltransferase [Sphingomonas sanxanigenens]